jgi:hypothetical protein
MSTATRNGTQAHVGTRRTRKAAPEASQPDLAQGFVGFRLLPLELYCEIVHGETFSMDEDRSHPVMRGRDIWKRGRPDPNKIDLKDLFKIGRLPKYLDSHTFYYMTPYVSATIVGDPKIIGVLHELENAAKLAHEKADKKEEEYDEARREADKTVHNLYCEMKDIIESGWIATGE